MQFLHSHHHCYCNNRPLSFFPTHLKTSTSPNSFKQRTILVGATNPYASTAQRLADEQLTAVDGLPELCRWVEDRGLKRAAVTNAPRPNVELMLPKLGLEDFFHLLVIGNECKRAKPFPDPYLDALKELKASPDHTFVFENSVSGTKAGVAAGMRVVGLTTSNPGQSLMNAGATFVIKNFKDPKLWEALEELEKT